MVLLGNTFPLTLVRRECRIQPIKLEQAKAMLVAEGFRSFWGHANTLEAANLQLGFDVAPVSDRPALRLTEEGLPALEGEVASTVVVLSPSYRPGFRPAIGVEVGPEDILGWEALLVTFP